MDPPTLRVQYAMFRDSSDDNDEEEEDEEEDESGNIKQLPGITLSRSFSLSRAREELV